MDVYLVPAGTDRYELYCETPTPEPEGPTPHASSIWQRMTATFKRAVAEGEAEQQGVSPAVSRGVIRRTITRKLAEAVAEQRLLWQLRGQERARFAYPDDLSEAQALEARHRLLTADRDKHRRWLIIDGLLVLASGLVALVPGPNVLAYYFIFRTVGHFLSMRGAMRGLSGVAWTAEPSSHLTAIRHVLALAAAERASRLDQISQALELDRLTTFVERMADRPS